MKICFLMEPPRSAHSVTHDIVAELRNAGADIDIVTERGQDAIDLEHLQFGYDLYLFKSHSPLAESIAAAAHVTGATLLNSYPSTMKVRDKMLTCSILIENGIPTPRTYVTDSRAQLRTLARERPIVMKPFRGRRGAEVDFSHNEAEFNQILDLRPRAATATLNLPDEDSDATEDGTQLGERLIFAQELYEHEPFDYKAYAIGDYVHTIKRIYPAKTKEEKEGTPVGNDPELDDLIRRCGKAFGLELYGVDLVKGDEGYSVIEVNCFPGYKGVPQAGRRIADYVLGRD